MKRSMTQLLLLQCGRSGGNGAALRALDAASSTLVAGIGRVTALQALLGPDRLSLLHTEVDV